MTDNDVPMYADVPAGTGPSMDHERARTLMAVAIEGNLSVSDERDLAVHLVGCADCKLLYSSLQQAELALRGLAFSHPPQDVLESAIARATTVLRGQADPGSAQGVATGDEDDFAPSPDGILQPAPIPIPAPIHVEPEPVPFRETAEETTYPDDDEPHTVRTIFTQTEEDEIPAVPEPEETVIVVPSPDVAEEPRDLVDEPTVVTEPPPVESAVPGPEAEPEPVPPPPAPRRPLFADLEESTDDVDLLPLPPRPGHEPVSIGPPPQVAPEESEPFAAEPADVQAVQPQLPVPPRPARRAPDGPRRRRGTGAWLGAITAAVILGLIALFVVTRSQTGGGSTPTAEEVRDRVQNRFAQMRSLKASFTIRRLDLYPVARRGSTMQYSFSDGTTTGRVVFDRAGGFREESTTEVAGKEVSNTRVAQTTSEQRMVVGTGANAQLVVIRNPAFGPPDGQFHPQLGSLERAVGSVAQMIVDTTNLEVVGLRRTSDRQVVDVRFTVEPTELSRADRIEAALDARTYVPVHVRREISRANGRVLAPESVLGGSALQTAFGNRDRILTEDVVLSDLVVDDVILPGDFVLDVPPGASTQNVNGSFQRVTRADLASKLPFSPLFPQSLPEGFTEQALEVLSAKPGPWGPNRSYPAPDGVLDARYSDGKTTVVITQRRIPSGPFEVKGPLVSGGTLPVQATPQTRAEKTFFYASSPELPPHAYGFLGNVFVVVTGYLPADDLVGILASMAQAPDVTTPPPVTTPSASPGASPDLSSPTATP